MLIGPLVIIGFLFMTYWSEQNFRHAVDRALIRNREVKNAWTSGYVTGFEVGKRSNRGKQREEDGGAGQRPATSLECERSPDHPVELKFWARESMVTVSRSDIFRVEQETRLSPMIVFLRSRGMERPLACEPSESLHRIIHTIRLDRWINAQRAEADDIDF